MGDFDASAVPSGLVIEAVDWLPSGGRSGLVRVRGRWNSAEALPLPELVVERGGEVARHASLPDPRAGRQPGAWRGAYVVHADAVQPADARLFLEFPGGVRVALPQPAPAADAAAPEPGRGEVVERAVLADRRARRAEAAEQAQARIAREALKAVEVLELRAAELEERLDATTAERDALAAGAAARVVAPPDPEVPELRRRLAEAEALVDELRAPRQAPPAGTIEDAERRADRLRDALTTAIGTVGELRMQLHEARVRSRTAEITHAAESVRARVLASERAALAAETRSLRQGIQEAEQLRTIQAAEIQAGEARLAGAEAAHEETRRRFSERMAELHEARSRIGDLEAELAALRAEVPETVRAALEAQERDLSDRYERAERAFAVRESEALAALEAARAELERVEAAARADVARAEAAQARAETERELAQAAAAAAEMKARAADVAQASGAARGPAAVAPAATAAKLENALAERDAQAAELARVLAESDAQASDLEAARAQVEAQATELAATASLAAELEQARALIATQEEALEDSRDSHRVLGAELDELRARSATLATELEAERVRRSELEAELDDQRRRAAQPAAPPVPAALSRHAAEQEQAAAAAPASADTGQLVADLAAAAEALRARTPQPLPAEPGPAAEPDPSDADREPEPEPELEPPVPAPFSAPMSPPDPVGPAIVSPRAAPARVATGRLSREYPALRGALVKLAHDDPRAAGRLLAGLLPAQWRMLDEPIDYDITIAEVGRFAVTVRAGAADVRPTAGDRGRPEAEFHLRTDALTLAEMLAGVGPRPRRFGRAKVSGRARRVKVLQPLAEGRLSLADAVRAGARLEPELVLRTLAYAVRPAWTAGQNFTIAHTFTGGDEDVTLFLVARDGRGLTVTADPPPEPPRATVVISRAAFDAMLRGEAPPPGERPATRGDHRAAQTLRAWADRARAGG